MHTVQLQESIFVWGELTNVYAYTAMYALTLVFLFVLSLTHYDILQYLVQHSVNI